jgi:hypothetical protein
MVVIVMVVGFKTTYAMPIATNIVSLNPAQERCALYNIMSLTCCRSVVSSTNKADCHDITEILLKVALNTINLNLSHHLKFATEDE